MVAVGKAVGMWLSIVMHQEGDNRKVCHGKETTGEGFEDEGQRTYALGCLDICEIFQPK